MDLIALQTLRLMFNLERFIDGKVFEYTNLGLFYVFIIFFICHME